MTKFRLITSLTDVQKFSEIIYDILRDKESPEEIQAFLSKDLNEDVLPSLQKMAAEGYPLSLDGKQ